MSGFFSSLGRRVTTEGMLINQDLDRFRGKKSVIAIMAMDRNHPEFRKAEKNFAALTDTDDLVLVAEHQPFGPLHERFHCKPQDFCLALMDKEGNAMMRADRVPSLDMIRRRLALEMV